MHTSPKSWVTQFSVLFFCATLSWQMERTFTGVERPFENNCRAYW